MSVFRLQFLKEIKNLFTKDEICKQKQIRLIRIKEKDWKDNNEYIKNFLKEELNIGRI